MAAFVFYGLPIVSMVIGGILGVEDAIRSRHFDDARFRELTDMAEGLVRGVFVGFMLGGLAVMALLLGALGVSELFGFEW